MLKATASSGGMAGVMFVSCCLIQSVTGQKSLNGWVCHPEILEEFAIVSSQVFIQGVKFTQQESTVVYRVSPTLTMVSIFLCLNYCINKLIFFPGTLHLELTVDD